MTGLIKNVRKWLCDDQGVTAVEYAVMLALILIAIISAINSVGGATLSYFTNDANRIGDAINGS